jgi:hypothetical protein
MNNSQPSNALTPQAFIDNFVTPTIEEYKQKSDGAKKKWQRFHLAQYFFVLLTPAVGSIFPIFGWGSENVIHAMTGISGLIAAYLTFVVSSGNYQLNFVQYESTRAALQGQLVLYSAGAKPYDTPDACKIFATNFERIVSDEVRQWALEMLGSNTSAERDHPSA